MPISRHVLLSLALVRIAARHRWTTVLILVAMVFVIGCSRAKYRMRADQQAYQVIEERNVNPEWAAPKYDIELDPRSRYFDPYDPDRPPMPPDDPESHQYMHQLAGMKGWKHWHDNGDLVELENPAWREALGEYVELNEDGDVKLSIDSALQLAYVHSPAHQQQLETLYLSALDVTTERFRLDTQFFGGYDARYAHNGSLIPPSLSYSPLLGRFIINPPIDVDGLENNRLTIGRPFGAQPAVQMSRRFATAGQLLVGFANSFVFEFTGSDANLAASLANFSFVQPLLRGAGKDIALEQLTIVERGLLANLRAYQRYRQGFYTRVAIGDGTGGLQRRGGFFGGTGLTGFTGQGAGGFGGVGTSTFGGGSGGGGGGNGGTGTGFAGGGAGVVGGYVGLLQQLQQIRNTEDSLSLQLRTLDLLDAYLQAGIIDLSQVDQFRQSIETERATLLQNRNGFEFALESYKTRTLGLPPDLPVELDDSIIRQFQLVERKATGVQDAIAKLQARLGKLPADAKLVEVQKLANNTSQPLGMLKNQIADAENDVHRMNASAPTREATMSDVEKRLFATERATLTEKTDTLKREADVLSRELEGLQQGLTEQTKEATIRKLVVWLSNIYRVTQDSILAQARARLEAVTVETIDLEPNEAFHIALSNRLDFKNNRAALVDSWRLIQFNADALQSVVNVTASGDIRTARNNAVSFRAPTANVRLGLEFDAPFTRLLERNNYRQSLIDYQRSRRGFIQARDGLNLSLRSQLRQINQLRTNLEIQRRAVAIAIRRVDLTREELNRPVPPPLPGQPPVQFSPTTATNLLTALSDLRNTQNNFMSVWLNYYAARMRLSRDLGVMVIDLDGKWLDYPLPGQNQDGAEQLPPAVPVEWIEMADMLSRVAPPPPLMDFESSSDSQHSN